MGSRCSGQCCKAFTIHYSPEELAEAARFDREVEAAMAAGEQPPMTDANGNNRAMDIQFIADMVIHLGHMTHNPVTQRLACHDGEAHHFYTCRHLLPNGDCGTYETRPRMCKEFPYGRECEYPGCTWTDASAATARSGLEVVREVLHEALQSARAHTVTEEQVSLVSLVPREGD